MQHKIEDEKEIFMKRNKIPARKTNKNFDNKPRLPQSQHLSFSSIFNNSTNIFSFWLAIFDGLQLNIYAY